MKKYLCMTILLFMNNIYAVDLDFGINLWAGITRAALNVDHSLLPYGPYDEVKQTGSIGTTVEIGFNKNISSEIGVFYINSGGNSERMDNTDKFANYLGKFYSTQELKSLEFPINIKYKWAKYFASPYIFSGITYSRLLSAKEVMKFDKKDDELLGNIDNVINNNNVLFDFGCGINVPLTKNIGINLMVKKSLGLVNQFDSDDSKYSQKSNNLMIMLGTSINI